MRLNTSLLFLASLMVVMVLADGVHGYSQYYNVNNNNSWTTILRYPDDVRYCVQNNAGKRLFIGNKIQAEFLSFVNNANVASVTKGDPVDATWGAFGGWYDTSGWSACSGCQRSKSQRRDRSCSGATQRCGVNYCTGSDYETQTVYDSSGCVVNGGWSDWSYGVCNGRDGSIPLTRYCNNPTPACGGASCSGGSTTTTPCRSVCYTGSVNFNSDNYVARSQMGYGVYSAVWAAGGGGGGGARTGNGVNAGGGGGGGAGEYKEGSVGYTPGNNLYVGMSATGTGGAGATSQPGNGGAGGNGGDTCVGGVLCASGGLGGAGGTTSSGGAGGSGWRWNVGSCGNGGTPNGGNGGAACSINNYGGGAGGWNLINGGSSNGASGGAYDGRKGGGGGGGVCSGVQTFGTGGYGNNGGAGGWGTTAGLCNGGGGGGAGEGANGGTGGAGGGPYVCIWY